MRTHFAQQGNSRADTRTRSHDPSTERVVIHESRRNTSGSSSSLNLNSWDGIIEDYFDDVSNINMPFNEEAGSGSNYEICVTSDESALPMPSTGPAERRLGSDLPETLLKAGSEVGPVRFNTAPKNPFPVENQSRPLRFRRNVRPPKFFGDQRNIDNNLEKEDTVSEVITLEDKPHTPLMVTFV